MRILQVHNFYQQAGGEDAVFRAEADLLESYGHELSRYTVHNDALANKNPVSAAISTIWNQDIYTDLQAQLRRDRPQVIHFHNTFPLISPAAYYAAKAENIPVVQTLHNYRLLCPNALFFREGKICESCLGKYSPWPAIQHRCYRGDLPSSTVATTMLTIHRLKRTWVNMVDAYIALTEFARNKFIQGGIPEHKLFVKPNFIHPTPSIGQGNGDYALFVGRLSKEKGITTLIDTWNLIHQPIRLKIIGDGPLAPEVKQLSQLNPNVEWLGHQPLTAVLSTMQQAKCLIFPSEWYEGLPRTIVESFAVGTPVIATKLGAMSSLIRHGYSGLHFQHQNPQDLKTQVEYFFGQPETASHMRQNARAEFEAHYTATKNYQKMIRLYKSLISS